MSQTVQVSSALGATRGQERAFRNTANPRISIVVPARNERANLEVILPKLPAVHEVILVDGHSIDGTVETAARVLPGIKIITQTRRGKGNALACGFAAVTGDIIVMFDADGSADPNEIPAFIAALTGGADVAKGSRYAPGGGSADITPLRDLGNVSLNAFANSMFGTKHSDLCYGYNAFWSDILPAFNLPDVGAAPLLNGAMHWGDGFEIETLIACRTARAGLVVAEVPSHEHPRIHGASNLNTVRDGTRVLRTILSERRRHSIERRVVARQSRVAVD